MTNTNPAALSLAEDIATTAVLEIRRLREVNAELLEALKHCRQKMAHMIAHGEWYTPETAIDLADTAIAKAEESK
jgi:hypothetical protein